MMTAAPHQNKKTILYLSPVDWRWIKQRPQFLAEEMARHFRVIVLYPWKNNRKGLQKKEQSPLPLHRYFMLPSLGGRFAAIGDINSRLGRWQLSLLIKKVRPDYLWLSHPMQWPMVPARYSGSIVYDCMDDYEAIEWNREKSTLITQYEAGIVRSAAHIFVSSMALQQKIQQQYGIASSSITLLRNGYNGKGITAPRRKGQSGETFKIGYFGTLGRWFDFELLLQSVSRFANIEYHIYGPLEKGIQMPPHPRLIYHGVIAHDQLMAVSEHLHALVMPFQLTDIVRSVDPVKLYEYIQMRLPILSVRYPEIERFAPFVCFYSDGKEYARQIEHIVHCRERMYSNDQALLFLRDNSWQKRADTVFRILGKAEEQNT